MINGRAGHGATLMFLPSGKVLVAGGTSGTATELYDTSGRFWSPTGSLGEVRYRHTLTLLSNNNVLVTGGFIPGPGPISSTAVESAELYDTSSGTWAPAGSVGERGDHTATWLLDGKVLVAGGHFYSSSGDIYRDDAILYDPASGNWSATGNLLQRRAHHTATLLRDGLVLVAGGFDASSNVLASAELYNSGTGTWSATGNLTHPRQYHTATLLYNGKVLVAGGSDRAAANFAPLGSAELYDPDTGTWTTTGSLAAERAFHTAKLLSSGRVLVTGGSNGNGALATAELYDPATGSWTSTGSLREPRSGHTASYTLSNQILIAGGGTNDSRSAELYTEPLRPPFLLNISTRLRIQNGDNAMIGGFIITGIAPKSVVLRALGPSLKMPGALLDPVIEVHGSSGELVATNDDWVDAATSQQVVNNRLAPTYYSESALWAVLDPGAYTVLVKGKDGATGIGLFEVYDVLQIPDSQLANVSTRGLVQTGDDVMIGGIIVGDGGTEAATSRVVVRAMGPSIPVAGALADPTVELHDGNGALVALNDDWKTRPDGSSQQAEIEATTIPPTADAESAIVQSLAPNNYTAIVRGKNNTTGIGLVEVYNLR
jgi:hypothetical protein